jgi:hypothetical protein
MVVALKLDIVCSRDLLSKVASGFNRDGSVADAMEDSSDLPSATCE